MSENVNPDDKGFIKYEVKEKVSEFKADIDGASDEFYTQYEGIQREINAYLEYKGGATVLKTARCFVKPITEQREINNICTNRAFGNFLRGSFFYLN